MKIVTGYRGTPHISANDQQAFNQGVIGGGNYVLDVGNHFEASLENVNTVQIRDGDGVIQGVHFRIEPGDFENVNIENGTTGFSRIDLVVARYSKDSTTGIESVDLVVIKGEDAASDPVEPAYNTGSILDSDSPVDFPLYRVTVNELTPSLTSLFGIFRSMPFTATRLSSATDGTFKGMYDPYSGVVTFFYAMRLSENVGMTTALWTVPSEYRPKSNESYCLFAYISSGTPIAYYGTVRTDGAVVQNASQSCRSIIGIGMYKI